MQYRKFGKKDFEVSSLGYGCMRFPVIGGDNKKINEEEAIKLVRHAIDKGVNYIDTAYPYHGGNSEFVVGKALSGGYREKVKLATKCPSWLIKSHEDFDKYLDEQLNKLGTEYIDMYLMHALDKERWENLKKANVFEFVERAKKQGKIKNIGFSFHDNYEVFNDIVSSYDWDFCQIQYNYIDEDYQAGKKGLRQAAAKGMAVVIMEPLKGGKLANPPESVKEIFAKADPKETPAGWGFKWLLNQPEVTVVLSGMNAISQIDENIDTMSKTKADSLSRNEIDALNEVKKKFSELIKIGCTGCEYCMPCPAGVDIPMNFTLLNRVYMFDDLENSRKIYNSPEHQKEIASNCRECGKCEKACPQHLEIRKNLKQVHAGLYCKGE